MGTDPYADDLTGRIDAAIAEVYRTESLSRAESHGAMRALGAFGAPAVDRVLELYRGSTTGPHEHARLLNGLGTSAVDAQAAARRAVAVLIADGLLDGPSALRGRAALTLRGRLLADAVVHRLIGRS